MGGLGTYPDEKLFQDLPNRKSKPIFERFQLIRLRANREYSTTAAINISLTFSRLGAEMAVLQRPALGSPEKIDLGLFPTV